MTIKLFIQAITKFLFGFILIGLLIFLPAGTLSFFNGWLFIGILFVPMFFAGIVMMFKNPDLLKSRLNAKEKQREQNTVIKLSGLNLTHCRKRWLNMNYGVPPKHHFNNTLITRSKL